MNTSESGRAAAQLASFNGKNRLYGNDEYNFAYVGKVESSNRHGYICVSLNGTLERVSVAMVVPCDCMYGKQSHTCIGVALKYVSPDTNVQEAIKKLDQSKIVANLRQMIADRKFAPIVPTL
jgi:hypothetical protein